MAQCQATGLQDGVPDEIKYSRFWTKDGLMEYCDQNCGKNADTYSATS